MCFHFKTWDFSIFVTSGNFKQPSGVLVCPFGEKLENYKKNYCFLWSYCFIKKKTLNVGAQNKTIHFVQGDRGERGDPGPEGLIGPKGEPGKF